MTFETDDRVYIAIAFMMPPIVLEVASEMKKIVITMISYLNKSIMSI